MFGKLFDTALDIVRLPVSVVADTIEDVKDGEPFRGENTAKNLDDLFSDIFD